MAERNLIVEPGGPVARVTVNRPKVRNALNRATLGELNDTFAALEADESVRAVILTGAGEKAFIAGADITELADLGPIAARSFASEGQRVVNRISKMGKPVVAAIQGFALGGGCEVALACHVRVGSTAARLGQPEVKLGVIPGWGGTQRLPRLIGLGRALELLITGDPITADEAYRIGLLNRVVEPEALLSTCEEIAARIGSCGPLAVRLAMEAAQRGLESNLAGGLRIEADAFGLAASTAEWREGTRAFQEKRKADFSGR